MRFASPRTRTPRMARPTAASVSSSRLHWLAVPGLLALGVVVLVMFQPWSSNAQTERSRDQFAADREAPPGGEKPVPFDGKRAMGYLEDICKIGPRISGPAGMTKQQELIEKHFKEHGGKVSYQRFTAKQRSATKPVEMANMVISYHPERARRVILCSHYDTRPIAHQEPNPRKWNDPFISATAGASAAAVLMQLAHHVKDLKSSVGIDFVLFDGEEYVFDPKNDEYFFGSKHFGKEYAKVRRKTTYVGAVLMDMVAGKGATFPVEGNSNVL